ncbi:hypothetical protein HanRHA438_Chr15g0684661 [Helianthus annuus]|nr:hypothetical protein HanRHA438_Chr15g0684661 [Helianthus annuus]
MNTQEHHENFANLILISPNFSNLILIAMKTLLTSFCYNLVLIGMNNGVFQTRDEYLVSGTGTEPYQVYSVPVSVPIFLVFRYRYRTDVFGTGTTFPPFSVRVRYRTHPYILNNYKKKKKKKKKLLIEI